jgi:hypothetical protein
MERDTPQPNQAMASVGTQAACGAALSALTLSSLAAELRELRARLRRAHEHAAAALDASPPGRQPGEALKRFLAADAEVVAIVRRIKQIQAFTKGWRIRPRGHADHT